MLQFLLKNARVGLVLVIFSPVTNAADVSQSNSAAGSTLQPVQSSDPSTIIPSGSPLNGPALEELPSWSEVMRSVLLTAIPHHYEDNRHWGDTTEVFDGFRVKQRGFDLRIREGKKTVNQGAWHRYKIELINPSQTLKLLFDQVQSNGPGRYQFNIKMASKLRCRADFEHWILGVKGLNATVVSEADVRILARCQLAIRTEFRRGSLLPDFVIDPVVKQVRLSLVDLDVRRIGEIRGDAAELLGDQSRRFLESLMQAQEPRVVQKANEAIQKKRSNLRIPASRLW